MSVNENDTIKAGDVVAKFQELQHRWEILQEVSTSYRVEARNPSNPAVVTEIDGIISFGKKIKRGNKEVIASKTGEIKKYLIPLSKHILVQENDFVSQALCVMVQ